MHRSGCLAWNGVHPNQKKKTKKDFIPSELGDYLTAQLKPIQRVKYLHQLWLFGTLHTPAHFATTCLCYGEGLAKQPAQK